MEEFAHTLLAELDYTKERRNPERYRQNLKDTEGIRLPRVYAEASGREVLTLEYIDGVRVDDPAALQGYGVDRRQLAARMARLLFRSAFDWGFFHADPHPGNFRVIPQGELVLLDFGLMGHLGRAERGKLLEVLAVVDSDAARTTDRLADLGVLSPRTRWRRSATTSSAYCTSTSSSLSARCRWARSWAAFWRSCGSIGSGCSRTSRFWPRLS